MAKQTIVWEHPVLGGGHYIREAASPRDCAEECADIFAGQPIRIRAYQGELWTIGSSITPDYEICNG